MPLDFAIVLAHEPLRDPAKYFWGLLVMKWIVAWGVCAIGASALAGVFAGAKNRDYSYWMFWCFLVPPLVIWLMLLPRYQGPRPRQPRLDELDELDNS